MSTTPVTARTNTLAPPVSARVSRVPLEKAPSRQQSSPITGGRKVAALTAGGMILMLVVGLLPAVATIVGR